MSKQFHSLTEKLSTIIMARPDQWEFYDGEVRKWLSEKSVEIADKVMPMALRKDYKEIAVRNLLGLEPKGEEPEMMGGYPIDKSGKKPKSKEEVCFCGAPHKLKNCDCSCHYDKPTRTQEAEKPEWPCGHLDLERMTEYKRMMISPIIEFCPICGAKKYVIEYGKSDRSVKVE